MFLAIEKSYNNCLRDLPFDGIIPSGKTMLQALKLGIGKIHRDTFHASLGVGRYLIGLVWYKYLTDKDITTNTFDSLDEPITNEQREIVIKAVNTILNK